MNYLILLLEKAMWANPYGMLFGLCAGIAIGLTLAPYLLMQKLDTILFAPAAIVCAALGGYVMAIAGGFIPYWIMRLVSIFR